MGFDVQIFPYEIISLFFDRAPFVVDLALAAVPRPFWRRRWVDRGFWIQKMQPNECSNNWVFVLLFTDCAILKAYPNRKWNRGTELPFDEFWVQIHGLTTQHLHYPLVNKTAPQDMQRIHSHLLSCIFWVIPCLTAEVVIVIVIVNQSSLYP